MLDHFGFLAPFYDKVLDHSDHRELLELLDLSDTGRILDVGGGTGRVAAKLKSPGWQIFVSDISAEMLLQAQSKGGLIPLLAHAEQLPFPDDSFDRIVVVDALHHFCDQRLAIRELLRVLKIDGRLIIEEPDIRRFVVKLIALGEKLLLMRSHFLTSLQIRDIISEIGGRAHIADNGQVSIHIIAEKQNKNGLKQNELNSV